MSTEASNALEELKELLKKKKIPIDSEMGTQQLLILCWDEILSPLQASIKAMKDNPELKDMLTVLQAAHSHAFGLMRDVLKAEESRREAAPRV